MDWLDVRDRAEPPEDRAMGVSDRRKTPIRVRGTVRVAPAVLLEMIEMTVLRVDGVAACEPWRRGDRRGDGVHEEGPGDRADRTFEAGGVRVRLMGNDIEAEVSVSLGPGATIAIVSHALRRDVGVAVNQMLGLSVRSVNVFVAGINDPVDRKGSP